MTTYTLSTYVASYNLASPVDTLSIASTGSIGSGGVTTADAGNYTVVNAGQITANGVGGVNIQHGGQVRNNSGNTITGSSGVTIGYGAAAPDAPAAFAAVTNYGSIVGAQGPGVGLYGNLAAGEAVTNGSATHTSAGISGTIAVSISGSSGSAYVDSTVTNFGRIVGAGRGVYVYDTLATITNGSATDSTALISGGIGVFQAGYGQATVDNFGTISGGDGGCVNFRSSADLLKIEGGSVFHGAIYGGGGTLDLASGAGTITSLGGLNGYGTISGGANGVFTGFGAYEIGGGAWTISSGGQITAYQSLAVDSGADLTILGNSALEIFTPTITNAGTIVLGGGLNLPAVLQVAAGVDLSLAGGGQVHLNPRGIITGAGDKTALTNVDNTLTGSGIIGNGVLTLDNQSAGVIDANGGVLHLRIVGTATNSGIIESSGSGVLEVFGGEFDSGNGGRFEANGTSRINLDAVTLVNGEIIVAKGSILTSVGTSAITITNASIINDGVIRSGTTGLSILEGTLLNSGTLECLGSNLTVSAVVAGTGIVRIAGSKTAEFDGAVSQNVVFSAGAKGVLALADVAAFTGSVIGLSKSGANAIDLTQFIYGAGDTAVYSASAKTLTILDNGTQIAQIGILGNYTGTTFTLSSAGLGGTVQIVDHVNPAPASRLAAFASAMAGLTSGSGSAVAGPMSDAIAPRALLAAPHFA